MLQKNTLEGRSVGRISPRNKTWLQQSSLIIWCHGTSHGLQISISVFILQLWIQLHWSDSLHHPDKGNFRLQNPAGLSGEIKPIHDTGGSFQFIKQNKLASDQSPSFWSSKVLTISSRMTHQCYKTTLLQNNFAFLKEDRSWNALLKNREQLSLPTTRSDVIAVTLIKSLSVTNAWKTENSFPCLQQEVLLLQLQ